MCFSASVGLTAGAVLTVVGLITLHKTQIKQELPFAVIPLLFGVQQFIEGILWLSLPKTDFGIEQYWLTQSYVFFIGIVWPTLIPLSLLLIEQNLTRKRIIQGVFALGIMVGAYTLSVIFEYGVTAKIINKCIVYQYPGDDRAGILAIYFIATCVAFFFSSNNSIRWIGAANIAGFIIAYYFYRINYASVWCFFAAVVSGLIYLYFHQRAKCTAKPAFIV